MPPYIPRGPKERIQAAAIDLFAMRGFSAVGVREIAKQADVNLAMINYYYGSKHELLETIVEVARDELREVLEVLRADLPLEDRIRELIHRTVEWARTRRNLVFITLSALSLSDSENVDCRSRPAGELAFDFERLLVQEIVGHLNPSLDPTCAAQFLLGVVTLHILLAPLIAELNGVPLDNYMQRRLSDQLADIVLYGLTECKRDAS